MKVIVRPDRIEFKHSLYTVVIPKASKISYTIFEQIDDIGWPAVLEVKSDNKKIESPIGFWGKLVYFIAKTRLFSSHANFRSAPTTVSFLNNIGQFLSDLKTNNYEGLDKIVELYNDFVGRKLDPKLVPGTIEWRKDKLGLIIGVFIFFELINIIIVAREDWCWFIGVSVGLLIICTIVYWLSVSVKRK